MRTSLLIFLLLVSNGIQATSGPQNQEKIKWGALHGLGDVTYFTQTRPKADESTQLYHIFTSLPPNYSEGDNNYPVVYLLDGGLNFPLFSSYARLLAFMEEIPPVILVGISYGSQDWRQGNNRSNDYTTPIEGRDFWGGAAGFEHYLIKTLMPEINKRFRVDTTKQVLFGQSLGGQFALYTSLYGKSPFYGVIASNPALHRNLQDYLKPITERDHYSKVFVSLAEHDAKQFREPAQTWRKHWTKAAPSVPLNIVDLPGHSHLSANPEAFRNGLIWLFN